MSINRVNIHLTTRELIETKLAEKMWVKVRLSEKRQKFLEKCLANHYIVVPQNITEGARVALRMVRYTNYIKQTGLGVQKHFICNYSAYPRPEPVEGRLMHYFYKFTGLEYCLRQAFD